MDNSSKFSAIIEKINKMIAELNILISKNKDDELLKKELNQLLADRDLLLKCDLDEFENLAIKYGDLINE